MAIVAKTKTGFHCGTQWHEKVVKCDAGGNFSIELPLPVRHSLGERGETVVYGKTINEVEKKYCEACEAWKNAQIKREKIILYRFYYKAAIRDPESQFGWLLNTNFGGQGYCFPSLQIEYFITTKSDYNGNITFSGLSWSDASGMSELPWTQEREDWFKNIVERFESLIFQIHGFAQDSEAMKALIDSGKNLLSSSKGADNG